MKKKLPFLFAITFLLPAACLAAYIIELENNAQFTTHHYWEKGNLIYFHAYGGIVGFRKDFIKRIQESDRPPVDDTNRLPKAKTRTEEIRSKPLLKPAPAPSPSKKGKEKRKYMPEFVLFKKRFKNVSLMNTKDLHRFVGDLTRFRNKILAERLGHLYSDQFVEIYAMADKVEDIIKARSQ